jgi:hypothetical protein
LPDSKENICLKLELALTLRDEAAASTALRRFLALSPSPPEFTSFLQLISSNLGNLLQIGTGTILKRIILVFTPSYILPPILILYIPIQCCGSGSRSGSVRIRNLLQEPDLKLQVMDLDPIYQGCGSGSGLDPDSATLWIQIRDPDSQYGSGSRGKKIKKFQWKNALCSYF